MGASKTTEATKGMEDDTEEQLPETTP